MARRGASRALAVLFAAVLLGSSAGCEPAVDHLDVRDSINAWQAARED